MLCLPHRWVPLAGARRPVGRLPDAVQEAVVDGLDTHEGFVEPYKQQRLQEGRAGLCREEDLERDSQRGDLDQIPRPTFRAMVAQPNSSTAGFPRG